MQPKREKKLKRTIYNSDTMWSALICEAILNNRNTSDQLEVILKERYQEKLRQPEDQVIVKVSP